MNDKIEKDAKKFLGVASDLTFEIRNKHDVSNHIENITKVFNENFCNNIDSETLRWLCSPSSINVDVFCLCKIASMLR